MRVDGSGQLEGMLLSRSLGLYTYSNPDLFFSHRFHGTSRGNNAAFLMLDP